MTQVQVHIHEAKTSAYWRSPEGIMQRIEMLSQNFTYKVVNNSLMFYGYSAGINRVRWATRQDERVCIICGPLEGRMYRKGQFLPPLPAHARCLTPETEVNTRHGLVPIKDVELGDYMLTHRGRYRRVIQLHKNPYEGKIYKLDEGWLTGNHPILTPNGWSAIDSIEDGDQVLSIALNGNRDLTPINLDPNKLPPSTSEEILLSSIEPPLRLASMPVTTVDFDGDLNVGDSKIQVVDVEGVFRDNGNLRLLEDLKESRLKGRHWAPKLHLDGTSNPFSSRDLTSPSGIMGGSNLGTSLLVCHLNPFKHLGHTLTPNWDSCINKATPDGIPGYTEVFGDLVLRTSVDVHSNDLLNGQLHLDEDPELIPHMWHKPFTPTTIDTDTYKNYVYNLSVDEDESYTLGKQRIIVHNCRCGWELLFDPDRIIPYVV